MTVTVCCQGDMSMGGHNVLTATSAADIIQHSGGEIQVIHATPEQVAQLQQTHQIQILQGEQVVVSRRVFSCLPQ